MNSSAKVSVWLLAVACIASPGMSNAAPSPTQCNQSAGPTAFVPLEASPFAAVAMQDGCTIFVSVTGDFADARNGIAVFSRDGGKVAFQHLLADNDTPYGMVLTHDGQLLIVANNTNVVVVDAERLRAGENGLLMGYISEPGRDNPLSLYANVSPDDRFLFVAEENKDRITVIDLAAARAANFKDIKILGAVPASLGPIALTFSPDGRYLYVTTQQADDNDHWPVACKPQGEDPTTSMPEDPEGAILVVDVTRAESDPAHSVVAKIPAGCSPVRLALSPDGTRAYVTARGDNALHVFDTAKLTADPDHARIASVPTGIAPVGVVVVDGGRKIVVANSNRFGPGPAASQTLTVIDAAKVASGKDAVVGAVPAGAFPRELALTADGKTILVANSDSDSLELVDVDQLPR
jgi:YVTN family beta-propeller protein